MQKFKINIMHQIKYHVDLYDTYVCYYSLVGWLLILFVNVTGGNNKGSNTNDGVRLTFAFIAEG